ncbi:MAG: amidohydrolase [Chloroflexi bacterium]|nr:amidohydrolase [Chloroflexota bacterium]
MIETRAVAPDTAPARPALIDCDVHNEVPKVQALFPYLPPYWVEHINQTLFKGPVDRAYPPNAPTSARPGSKPADGSPAGSSLALLQEQVLDPDGVETAILNTSYSIDSLHNPDAAVALASAVNDWQIAEWLDKDARLRASIVVPSQIPELAAREIERVGDHPGFVQVSIPVRTPHPLGSRLYRPLWDAIARKNLVAAVHFGGSPGVPPTPTGWPSYYLEQYAGMAQVFATQLTSIVSEGVFDQWPSLRMVLLEAGFTWLPPHMWRFDKEWKNLRRLIPWVKRPPSEYIREHVSLTIQPIDGPPNNPRQLLQIVDQLGSEDMLLYASDYPHEHAADPDEALLRHLPETLARKIRSENARALYGL